jgi:hypothetical protein
VSQGNPIKGIKPVEVRLHTSYRGTTPHLQENGTTAPDAPSIRFPHPHHFENKHIVMQAISAKPFAVSRCRSFSVAIVPCRSLCGWLRVWDAVYTLQVAAKATVSRRQQVVVKATAEPVVERRAVLGLAAAAGSPRCVNPPSSPPELALVALL